MAITTAYACPAFSRAPTWPAPAAVLETRQLTRRWQDQLVLQDINFSLISGEVVALLGENGAGKTTLLHCLANRLRPCGGEVLWFGNSPRRRPEDHRLVGLVAHESSLYPELTIRQNLSFAARMFGISDVRGRVAAQLACAGMERLADRSVSSLSRGQRQRVEILRAVVHSPSLVLLDEPYSGLDVFGRQWLEEKMAGWRSEGKAVCFTSHDEPHCFRVAERVLRLDGGKLLPVSRPAD